MNRLLVSRLLAPLGVVSMLLLVTATGSAWYVRGMQRSMSAVLAENVTSVVAAQEFEDAVREIDAGFDRYLATGDRAYLEAVPRLRRQTANSLESAERLALTAEEQALMVQVRRGYDRLFAEFDRAYRNPSGSDLRPRIAALAAIPERDILGPAREYRRLNEEALSRTSRANERVADRLTVGLVALGGCGATAGLLAGSVITTAVRRSIRRAEDRLRSAAARLSTAASSPQAGGDPVDWITTSADAVLARLEQSERDALRAEQLARVGQMAAGVAHEVRNPLAAIKILVQAAADPQRATPFRAKDLAVIEREIGRLERIVAGFLDYARPPRPDKSVFRLGPFMDEVAAGVRSRADLLGVAIVTDLPAEPVSLCADPNQLRQVLVNLLDNALDALPGGGRVRVSATVGASEQGTAPGLVLTVEDDGCGLPAALADRIFEPFVSTKEVGLGLGLSICRRIVESHGGTIRAAARSGGGTTFTVRLPRSPSAAPIPLVPR